MVRFLTACGAGIAAVGLTTFLAFRLHLNVSSAGFLYLLLVLVASILWGFRVATVVSLFAVNCLDYFFVPPIFSFTIGDPQNLVALATFEITALLVSRLSARLKAKERAELEHRLQVDKLYELSRRILLLEPGLAVRKLPPLIQDIFALKAVAIFQAERAESYASAGCPPELETRVRDSYLSGKTSVAPEGEIWLRMLRLGNCSVGAIALHGSGLTSLTADAVSSLSAIALERVASFEKQSRADGARQTEQLRSAVLDSLAHAFKSPLTAIRVASSGLLDSSRLTTADLELAELIDDRAEYLNQLTSQLLSMARLDASEVSIRAEPVCIADVVEKVLARERWQLQGRPVDTSGVNREMIAWADPGLLRTALEQLVDNAAKYSAPGSVIAISADGTEGEIVIGVHNEGPTIPQGDREKVFERFYRAEETRRRTSGTGLGLSIARKIAEAHRGRAWVVSDAGTGTTFSLAVPRASKGSEHEPIDGARTHC
jgi:two-component system sensor histidine kinase KdpD